MGSPSRDSASRGRAEPVPGYRGCQIVTACLGLPVCPCPLVNKGTAGNSAHVLLWLEEKRHLHPHLGAKPGCSARSWQYRQPLLT